MSKIELVRQEMFSAMKNKETERKNALSLLLSALKAKEKDKLAPLTEEEENNVILKELKQTKETLESAPNGHDDIIKDCEFKISVISEFAPKRMSEDEIRAEIEKVIASLDIEKPTMKEKGLVMKNLMPLVSGKADGGLVNKLVGEYLS